MGTVGSPQGRWPPRIESRRLSADVVGTGSWPGQRLERRCSCWALASASLPGADAGAARSDTKTKRQIYRRRARPKHEACESGTMQSRSGTDGPAATRVLILSTVAFTLLFAVWLMLGVLGVTI